MQHDVIITLGFSRSLALFIIGIHSFAGLMVLCLPCAWYLQLLLCVGLAFLALQQWRCHLSRSQKGSVLAVWQDSRGHWGLRLADGRCLRGHLTGDSFKHPCLLVLCLKTATCRRYVTIPRDALDDFAFRTLSTRIAFY